MNLDENALKLFLYMYALKDDVIGFQSIVKHLDINDKTALESFKWAFHTACDSDSNEVLKYILNSPLIDNLDTQDFDKATVAASYKGHTEVMCQLLSNETVLNKITFDSKLIFSINQISNDKAFELMKCLLEKGKYKVSEHGDDIFNFARERANESLIEYLFINTLSVGEQLPQDRLYEVMLTKQENISPIFLNLVDKLDIKFSEEHIEHLKIHKNDLYNLLEKKNLFERLNFSLKEREKTKKMKI